MEQTNLNEQAEKLVGEILTPMIEPFETDCIGDMISFMDSRGFSYPANGTNADIRESYRNAMNDYVIELTTTIRLYARITIFGAL